MEVNVFQQMMITELQAPSASASLQPVLWLVVLPAKESHNA